MEKEGEKGFNGQKNEGWPVDKPRTVISRRLGAGRTIQLDFKTKARLLTIISRKEGKDTLNQSLIIEEGRTLRIVLIADPFAPEVSMYVSTVENL